MTDLCNLRLAYFNRVLGSFVVRFEQSVWWKEKNVKGSIRGGCQKEKTVRYEKWLVPGARIEFVVFTGSGF